MSGRACGNVGFLSALGQYYGPQPYAPPQRSSSGLAVLGGILILISGIIGLVESLFMFWLGDEYLEDIMIGMEDMEGVEIVDLSSILLVCGALLLVFSILAILGGLSAAAKKSRGVAIMGGVFGLFLIGPYLLASILALIGIVLVIAGREDFEKAPPVVVVQQVVQPPGQTRVCLGCGQQIPASFHNCPHCGRGPQ